MCEETGAPGGNPHTHGKNTQTYGERPQWGLNPGLSYCEATVEATDPTACHKMPKNLSMNCKLLPEQQWESQRELDSGVVVSNMLLYTSQFGKHEQAVSQYESFPKVKKLSSTFFSTTLMCQSVLWTPDFCRPRLIITAQNFFAYFHPNWRKASRLADNYFWQYVTVRLLRAWFAVLPDWISKKKKQTKKCSSLFKSHLVDHPRHKCSKQTLLSTQAFCQRFYPSNCV